MCSRTVLSLLDHEVGFGDALLLDPLTKDAFIQNLGQRFKRDQIYTYIGNMVVSINPYKRLAIYTPEVIEAYQKHNMYQLPPHIYALADNAYQSMKAKNQDQCIIISGESGSGKTEAGKLIMQYIVAYSCQETATSIGDQLLQSNVILEAFGNAKTQRNDNASRFGKYIDIEFDFKGDPEGGVISNYLMEKSRVTNQSAGERNFHIFYQLLSGAEVSLLKSLKLLRNVENYTFLKPRSIHAESLDDKHRFSETKRAFEIVGFTADEFQMIFQVIAAVIKLGNIEFVPNANLDGTEGCLCTNEYEIEDVCSLLNCQMPSFQTALTHKMVEARLELVMTELTACEATHNRDSLCKAMYSRLFTWIVHRINENIRVKKHGRRRAIGILDIYGFEVFDNNGFEQLIINYCNEKLHQMFIEQTLRNEQEEYSREGISWTPVEFEGNCDVCDLLEKNSRGILSLLDEECTRLCHATDESFLRRLDQVCVGHPSYVGGPRNPTASTGCKQSRRRSNPNLNASIKANASDEHRKESDDQTDCESSFLRVPENCFGVQHFAGTVTYNVSGFLDKNHDLVSRDLSQHLFQCEHVLIKILFPEGNPKRTTLKRPVTAAAQFKIAINALMKNLQPKIPSYVRCIKPNELKQPLIFEMALVQHQIRYLGLIETVRLQQVGFAFHQTYEQFLFRYKMLSLNTWPSWKGLPSEGVSCLLKDLPIPSSEYAFGRSKVFIHSHTTIFDLEEFRRLRLDELACLIQKTYRGWMQRKRYLGMKRSQAIIAAHWKGHKLRRSLVRIRREAKCSRVNRPLIDVAERTNAYQTREAFTDFRQTRLMQWATVVIQRTYRNHKKMQYLIHLSKHLPSMSPIARGWVPCPPQLQETSRLLWRLYHKWRCHKYRNAFDQTARNRMREKVTASIIFRDKKASYQRSVSHPFHGDYVRLRHNAQWKKLCSETNDHYVVFADIVNKVTRSAGKCVPILFVLSTSSMLILDHRTMQIKYRVPIADIYRVSLSPFLDDIAVFHVRPTELTKRKGDFVFQACHVIEIVTKVFLVVQNATGKPTEINIASDFEAIFGNHLVTFVFKSTGLPEVQPGQVKIARKATRMEVIL